MELRLRFSFDKHNWRPLLFTKGRLENLQNVTFNKRKTLYLNSRLYNIQ